MAARKIPRLRVPVLMYHALTPRTGSHPCSLAVARFRGQLALLRALGYSSVSPEAVAEAGRGGRRLPARAVAITFDDGYVDTLTVARPLLWELGFTATCYFVAGALGGVSYWTDPAPLMDWDGVRAWHAAGMRVGSHSLTHRDLTTLTDAEVRDEVIGSKRRLEERLGSPVRSFAYPFNRLDRRAVQAVREAGYDTACGGPDGADPVWALPRVDAAHDSWGWFLFQLLPGFLTVRRLHHRLVRRRPAVAA